MDLKFRLQVIDHYCSFKYLLSYRDSEHIELNPNDYTPNSSVYCPFHENTESKAAKLYPPDKEVNSEKLYCFAENVLYYPHNLLTPDNTFSQTISHNSKFKSIVPFTPSHVFNMIWSHLPESDKQYWYSVNPDIKSERKTFNKEYDQYKLGEITLFKLLQILAEQSTH